jgi:hypothetical protein
MEKYGTARQATDDYNTVRAICMLDSKGCKHTLRIHNTYCFLRQQRLRDRAPMLRLYVHYILLLIKVCTKRRELYCDS